MATLSTLGSELGALGLLALSVPLRLLLAREHFDPEAPYPTPVVFVHGLLGDPTNFLVLRRFVYTLGIRNVACFSYAPQLDYRRVANRLCQEIETICRATGAPRVDVVGHSLGGLLARYLVEVGDGRRVRRLVTLGAPCFSRRLPVRERAIFGEHDLVVRAPRPPDVPHGRVVVIPDCGHWGLLYHPAALHAVGSLLTAPGETATHGRCAVVDATAFSRRRRAVGA